VVEENKQELKKAWFDKKILIFKQIPASSTTEKLGLSGGELGLSTTRLSDNVIDMLKNGVLILFFAKVWIIPHFARYKNTFGCLEILFEIDRGVGKLTHSSLGLLLHSWLVFPFLGWRRDRSRLEAGDANVRYNWSM